MEELTLGKNTSECIPEQCNSKISSIVKRHIDLDLVERDSSNEKTKPRSLRMMPYFMFEGILVCCNRMSSALANQKLLSFFSAIRGFLRQKLIGIKKRPQSFKSICWFFCVCGIRQGSWWDVLALSQILLLFDIHDIHCRMIYPHWCRKDAKEIYNVLQRRTQKCCAEFVGRK